MSRLIILNHQPDIPPFMVSDMRGAKDVFDELWYVNTRYPVNASLFEDCPNVHFVYPSGWHRCLSAILAFFQLFKPSSLKQIIRQWKARKTGTLHFVKQLGMLLAADNCIRPLAVPLIDRVADPGQVTVLSTWFGGCAMTAATLKKKRPQVKAYSLAHSYEILVSRNPDIPYLFVQYKHQYLDGVFFIAQKMLQLYLDGVGPLPESALARMRIRHLGSFNREGTVNPLDDTAFHVCTCSRMIPLKRLDVLCEALKGWKGEKKLVWTHLGDGLLDAEIRAQAAAITNPRVEVHFKGHLSNDEVKTYYAQNPVDLFCNISSIEGLPISIMEAMSFGIPVMATDVGATSEIVRDGAGILIGADITASGVLSELQYFEALPAVRKHAMRNAARTLWEKCFDAEKTIPAFYDSIKQSL